MRMDSNIIIVTQGWVVNGVRRHTEPLGDNDPPQLFSNKITTSVSNYINSHEFI
jgi:hypothetical protein